MARDCLLAYPNHNKPFHIYTDASSHQMVAYIVQDDKTMAYWLRKLNDAQLKYSVGDKELLSIVMVLTKFSTMLLGELLHIPTDHLKITTNNTTPDHIICWLNMSNNSTLTFTLSLIKTTSLPIHSLGLIALKNQSSVKTNKFLSSKILSPKGWILPLILFSLNNFCICHL